jgi:hypothetical protein
VALSKKQLATSFVAIVATEVFSGAFDDVFMPLMIGLFGPLYGGGSTAILAFLVNYLLVLWYRRTEYDWYGFEAERKLEIGEKMNKGILRRFTESRVLTFVMLSVWDPFLGFVYFEGRKENGTKLDVRDWMMFVLANLIGIFTWMIILVVMSEKMGTWVMFIVAFLGVLRIFKKLYDRRAISG